MYIIYIHICIYIYIYIYTYIYIYINISDLDDITSQVLKVADDTKYLEYLKVMQIDLNKLTDWSDKWLMFFMCLHLVRTWY